MALNWHQWAQGIVEFLQLQFSPEKEFYRGGHLLKHEHLLKHISINILNKIPQMVVPKTGDHNQRGVKWKCSCKQFHFDSVSEHERCFKLELRLSTSEADTQSDNLVSFFFKCFLSLAFHWQKPWPCITIFQAGQKKERKSCKHVI